WTVTNLGPDTAPAVTWRASLPLGLGLDQITPSQGQCGGVREIACELGELPVNGRITLPIAMVALQAGAWSQSATVASAVADPHPDNNTAQFELIVASAAETFVEFLSAQLLARPLSAEEQVWIDRLEQGQLTPAALIAEMLALAEYRQRVLPIARLYPTILGRDPDLAGLHDWVNSLPWEPALATPANSVDPTDPVTNDLNNMELINWIHQTSTGQALVAIAAAFLQSAEFIERFGASLDDEAFITLLYQNALNRRPDPAGRAWWIRELTAGRDRAEVALLFAHANEQRTTRDRKLGLALLYQILLGRLPTDAEVADALTREITEVIAALLVHPDYIGPPQP
ncbi:MAG: hypothetical protein QG599_263, partial [Pseudomonadota bacterium]|nr:hypothetical protein [Pseudomonadota bacterium]